MLEVSTQNLEGSAASDSTELLARIEQLAALGTVVVSDYPEGYQFFNYLRRYTAAPIRVILWISMFVQKWKKERSRRCLEPCWSFGRLLSTDVTIYVAPMCKGTVGGRDLLTLDDFLPKSPLDHLFRYLRAAGRIVPLEETQAKT
jgi:hypothetical protein